MIIEINTYDYTTYISLSNEKVSYTESQGDYIIDFAKDGSIIGIEYLSVPKIKVDEKQIKV